jgi:hypothetical protein
LFAPNELQTPPPPPQPIRNDRLVGALVLLAFIILCLLTSLGMDQALFIPYNATHAITQTWQANHPATPGSQLTPRNPSRRRTSTPNPGYDQQVRISH